MNPLVETVIDLAARGQDYRGAAGVLADWLEDQGLDASDWREVAAGRQYIDRVTDATVVLSPGCPSDPPGAYGLGQHAGANI